MKKLKRWWKKLCVGLAAVGKIDSTNKTIKAATVSALVAVAGATANAQSYSTYNYGGMYYGNNNNTFQNQNTGGYTYGPPAARSDNWFMRALIYTLGGLKMQAGGTDPTAPKITGNGTSSPRQQY